MAQGDKAMELKGKTVMITGASAGIGEGCAVGFAEQGSRLILVARRNEKLSEVAERLRKDFGVEIHTVVCDVRNSSAVANAIKSLPKEWKNIDILVNNAGLARGLDKIQNGSLSDWDEMIDTNVKGLLYVSRAVLPGMVERGTGLVVNIASLAGREVYPLGNVYCGTKHAVKAISKGMTLDLNGTGVRVTNIDPGLVETEFSMVRFHGDKEKADTVYKGYKPLTGYDIGRLAVFAAQLPDHINLQDMLVTPAAQASPYVMTKRI